jgi:hypothetical protein
MSLILFHVKEIKPELEFYRKMSGAKTLFVSPPPAVVPNKP